MDVSGEIRAPQIFVPYATNIAESGSVRVDVFAAQVLASGD
jgi:hypothetical protein